MVIECLVELEHVFVDKLFTYKVPEELREKVKIGMRVSVPFGHQTLEGFILAIREDCDEDRELKYLYELVDDDVILNEELLMLGKYIQETTLCSLMSAYQVMLPKAYKAKSKSHVSIKVEKYISLNKNCSLSDFKFTTKQLEIITLLQSEGEKKKKELDSISSSCVKTLLTKGVLELTEKEVSRFFVGVSEQKNFCLNEDQEKVKNEVVSHLNEYLTYLLYGVTGSGKTNVYMKIIEEVIARGKSAIVLVPEISLTPQIIKRFTSMFSRIAILHSGLSDGEKYDEYRKIRNGEVDIVIGARSAIFAPLTNIGVIIVDEEHSSTYKQESTPRYHAVDIAKKRASFHQCPLILGSATPSLESFARAERKVYHLLPLTKRYNEQMLPEVNVIDMNQEFKKANGYFSNLLISKIQEKIDCGDQVILFLNKRGYTSLTSCKNCGFVEKCPYCDISLTYHKSSNMLRCHYCGYATKREKYCRDCHEEYQEFGLGTEKVEEEIEKLISGAKVIRMDVDTTSRKSSHEKIVNAFASGEYNILLGTQMIAKGLDFPNVTLVGVINADISLNFPDFRSSEVTFQLLNQVAGRSGRGDRKGEVLIQTFNPDHYAIRYAKSHDYMGFYREEMAIRRKLKYPPFYYICQLRIISKDYKIASDNSITIANFLKKYISNEIILGPSVSNIFKLNNKYRFQIIIKYKDVQHILPVLKKVSEHYFNKKDVKVEIDFNPLKL